MKPGNLLLLSIVLLSVHADGQSTETRIKEYNISKSGLAVEGYDVVSYFLSEGPVKGKKEYSLTYNGITYWFRDAANLNKFKSDPSHYEPAYGGWCAYAMGNSGEKVEVDPETFKILNGKLYLFYNAYFNNTLPKWNKNEQLLKATADKNWNKFIHRKP